MSRAGVPSDHAERYLGHVIGGVRGTYDRHRYLDEMAAAYDSLARQVRAIAFEERKSMADLIHEGLDLMLRERGFPTTEEIKAQ